MKKTISVFIGSIIFLLLACNNQTDTQKAATEANLVNIPQAEKELKQLIAQYPDSFELKENLVQYFKTNGNYSSAIAVTENALEKDNNNSRFLYIKAMLLSENEDTLKAITAWEELVAVQPSPDNLISLATMYAFTKNPKTLPLADVILKVPNAKPQAMFIKGLYQSNIGNKTTAIKYFDSCLSDNYTYLFAYREKAICLYDTQQYLDALKTLELAVSINKGYEEAYYWMGKCFEKLNKKEQAIQNYQLALQIDPNFIEAKDALGKLGFTQ